MTEKINARLRAISEELDRGDLSHLDEYNVLAQKTKPSNLFGHPLHKANYAVAPGPVQQTMKDAGIDTIPGQRSLESTTRSREKTALVAQVAYAKSAWQHDPDRLDAYTASLSALEQHEQQEKQRG